MQIRAKYCLAALVAIAFSASAIAPLKFVGLTLYKRNYTGNVTATDSGWFYKESNGVDQDPPVGWGVYNSLEFDFGRGAYQIPKVVYVRGNDITVELTWYNPLPFTNFSGTLTINGARLIVPTSPTTYENLGIEDDEIPFTCNAQSYQTISVTFTDVPNYVTYGDLQIDAIVTGNIGHQVSCEGPLVSWGQEGWQDDPWERVYLVYETPEDLQTAPWTDLLEWTCKWAIGKNSASDVSKFLTLGFFWNANWVYNDGSGPCFWVESDSSYKLDDALHGAILSMDCRDVSGFLTLSMQSQGLTATCRRLWNADEPETDGFYTNLVCPMGLDANASGGPPPPYYTNYEFGFHQVAMRSGAGVYDSAIAQYKDLGGSSYRNPPIGWNEDGYWQTAHSGGYYGLTDGPVDPRETAQVTKGVSTKTISGVK